MLDYFLNLMADVLFARHPYLWRGRLWRTPA